MAETMGWGSKEVEALGLTTVILGGQGGAGKTTLAIGLAAVLNQHHPGRVALVDLDLQFGDLGSQLGVRPSLTWADVATVVAGGRGLHALWLASRMPSAAGLRLLCAPVAAEQAAMVGPEHVRAALAMLKMAFDHVVIDAGGHFGDEVLEAVDLADRVVMVGDLNPSSVGKTRIGRALLTTFGVPVEKILLALNHCDRPSPLSPDQLQAELGWVACGLIPHREELAATAGRIYIPIVDVDPASDLTESVAALARHLNPPRPGSLQRQVDATISASGQLWTTDLTRWPRPLSAT